MNTAASAGSVWSVRQPKISEALGLLVAAWLVPFLVHLVPWHGDRPLGVYLLPVFWTTLVAAQVYGLGFALAVGLVTPLVNLALTGLPAAARLGPMTLEVMLFAVLVTVMLRKAPRFFLAAPLAYVLAKAAAIAVQWAVPTFEHHRHPGAHWAGSVENGMAGLLVLAAVNVATSLWQQRRTDWDAE